MNRGVRECFLLEAAGHLEDSSEDTRLALDKLLDTAPEHASAIAELFVLAREDGRDAGFAAGWTEGYDEGLGDQAAPRSPRTGRQRRRRP